MTYPILRFGNNTLYVGGEDLIFKKDGATDTGENISWGDLIFDGITNLTGTRRCTCDAILTWTRALNAEWPPISYTVYYDTTPNPFDGTEVDAEYALTYTIRNLNASQLYYFGVRATNSSSTPFTEQNTTVLSRRMPYPCHIIGTAWSRKATYLTGTDQYIFSIAEHNDKIYGGTGDWTGHGELLEWDGSSAWIKKATQFDNCESITSLLSFKGSLYGTGFPGGRLLKWNNVDAWVEVATGSDFVRSLTEFNNKLYATAYKSLLEWNEVDDWIIKGSTPIMLSTIIEFDSKLYCAGGAETVPDGSTALYEWDGSATLTEVAPHYTPDPGLSRVDHISRLVVSNGNLYGTTYWGRLLEWNGSDAWSLVAERYDSNVRFWAYHPSGAINFCNTVFAAEATGDTYPGGRLFEWNGTGWQIAAAKRWGVDGIMDLLYFNRKLYAGAGSQVYSDRSYLLAWE